MKTLKMSGNPLLTKLIKIKLEYILLGEQTLKLSQISRKQGCKFQNLELLSLLLKKESNA